MYPQRLGSTTGCAPGILFRFLTLVISLPSLGMGCVSHHRYASFEGPECLGVTSPMLRVRVDEEHEFKNYGFIWATTTNAPPHSLVFYSSEPTGDVDRFVITELEVTYHAKRKAVPAARLPATAVYEDASYGPPHDRTREFDAKLTFESLIDRDESFTLSLRGYYLMKDGSKRPFESNGYFEMTKKNELKSLWVEMMSV